MSLPEKLKSLRAGRELTQETVAEHLGVSAQTVSKWERGLLSPDIRLLPKIAVLYETSLDALFDMDTLRGDVRREDFRARVYELRQRGDTEGVYHLLLAQIELVPDDFIYYPDLMLYVRQHFAGDAARIRRMVHLAEYADRHCRDDFIRNEIHLQMAHICRGSTDPHVRQRSMAYLEKLPLLRHNRETQLPSFLEGDARDRQVKWNILQMTDRAECAVRLLIREDMTAEEKLALYRTAVALYDTVLGDGYGGFWDVPRLADLSAMVRILLSDDRRDEADEVMERFLTILGRHADPDRAARTAPFVSDPHPEGYTAPEVTIRQLVHGMLGDPALSMYHNQLTVLCMQIRNEK